MQPKDFEMAPCKCGNTDCQWSEYRGRLWCPVCKMDFVPDHAGVIDGPVGVEVCRLLGIVFDSFDLTTQQVVPFEADTWPLSPDNPAAKKREQK